MAVGLFLRNGTEPLDEEVSLRNPKLWLLTEFLCLLIIPDETEFVERRQITRLASLGPYPIPFVCDGSQR